MKRSGYFINCVSRLVLIWLCSFIILVISMHINVSEVYAAIWNNTAHLIGNASRNSYSMSSGDLDGDGDMDIVYANYTEDSIFLLENDGSANFTETIIDNGFMAAQEVDLVDLDKDGDMDIIGSSHGSNKGYSDEVAWWENDGSQNFIKHLLATSPRNIMEIFGIDFDLDGDIDILGISRRDDDIVWWENDGNENFARVTIDGNFNSGFDVYPKDIDGDGDMDVTAASSIDDEIAWWENDGSSQNFTKHVITSALDDAEAVYAEDIDSDGDVDIVGAAWYGADVIWWENDGSQNFSANYIDTDFYGAYDISAVDLDGDSDIDIIGAADERNDIVWWRNDGNENFTKLFFDSDFSGANEAIATDLDGDNDLDIVGGAWSEGISWWENDFLYQISFLNCILEVTDSLGNSIESSSDTGLNSVDQITLSNVEGIPIASFGIDLESDVAWDSLFASTSEDSALLHYPGGFSSMPGVSSTGYDLYTPRKNGQSAVYICPGATVLDEVYIGCSGGYTLDLADSRVSLESRNITRELVRNEDFSSDTFPPVDFSTGGNSNWYKDSSCFTSPSASAASADITDSEMTWFDLDSNTTSVGELSFDWKVSSEEGYDYLIFCLNDDQCWNNATEYAKISGEQGWTTVTVPLVAGSHSFRWYYSKDGSVSEGSDMGWVDNIIVTETVDETKDYFRISGLTGTGATGLWTEFLLKDTLTRLEVSQASDHTIEFGSVNGLTNSGDTIEIQFDPAGQGWDLSSIGVADIDLEDDGVDKSLAAAAGADTWGVSINTTTDTITFSAPTSGTDYISASSILVVKIGTVADGGTNQIVNPSTAAEYEVSMTNTYSSGTGGTETGDVSIPIVDDDTVNITGYIDTVMSFDIDTAVSDMQCDAAGGASPCDSHGGASDSAGYVVDLGELTLSTVNKSGDSVTHADGLTGDINYIWFDLETNASSGAVVTVVSQYEALYKDSTNEIPSVATGGEQQILAASGLYGLNHRSGFTNTTSIGSMLIDTDCDASSGDDYYCDVADGGTPISIFDSNSLPIDDGRMQFSVGASPDSADGTGTYTDQLTFIASPTF